MFENQGVAVDFSSGFLAEILDMSGPELTRDAIDVSYLNQTEAAKLYMAAALYDGGEVTFTIGFAPGTSPPIANVAETLTITWPDSAGTAWSMTVFMTNFAAKGPMGDKATADITLKVSGEVNFAA